MHFLTLNTSSNASLQMTDGTMTLYMPLFRCCSSTSRTLLQLHAYLLVTGRCTHDPLAATKLIESYAKMGAVDSSRSVFDTFSTPDPFMWAMMIKSYVWNLFFTEAISLYHEMLSHQLHRSSFIFPSLLKAASGLHDMGICGKKLHGRIIKSGFQSDAVVEAALLHMYGEMGSLDLARQVFDCMSVRDVVSWSSMISTFVRNGQAYEGLELFREMVNLRNVEPDYVMLLSVTQACADLGFLRLAESVHGYSVSRDIEMDGSLKNSLVAIYCNFGRLDRVEKIFQKASQMSVISWTAIISCYNQMSLFQEALGIYLQMQESGVKGNSITMVSVLLSCGQLGCLREGRSVHGFMIRTGIDPDFNLMGVALIDMYACCRKLGYCEGVFETIKQKTVVSWNSLITVYARNGLSEKALELFVQMRIEGLFPDSFTLASSLSACRHLGISQLGCQIHGHIAKTGFQHNEYVQNSLIDMYCKCGFVDIAYGIFDKMEGKCVVTWNSMMGGLAQNGNSVEAIVLFDQMHSKGLEMDTVTFVSAIQACSHLGYLEKGRWVHHKLITYGLEKDTYVDTALTDMYAKCGDLQMARMVFDNMTKRNVVSWSVMIAGYGIHGYVDVAISLFSQMIGCGIRPNNVTFMNMLSACSHVGAVEAGQFYFDSMAQDFGIEPELEHCACMVDLLSRAGHLDSAYSFIKSMPVTPNASIWGAFLGGCRIHRKMDMIDDVGRKILALEPGNSGYYTLLSNIYAEGGRWDAYGNVKVKMKDMGLRKVPGYSTIEMKRRIYRFCVGDTSHLQTKEIYSILEDLERLAHGQGYISDRGSVLLSSDPKNSKDEGMKENNVGSHSERLAIAFGIINTSPGTTLRISKNLRVCCDCHSFTKFVSKITNREIIMRDLNRFHHFKNGICSCGDYW
ncbi:putative pentatricopeptide repeat-containing protein At1g69350, mitochondrial [Magnolia sinica]|uniref:putative pentatricopeptide repeat-containing protein At1g69350, mitochondrial n=1 Tax=Magnolia sinica TaxID=86752 RepID=UPI002659E76B|nr:putative pentatricopeptide repeat-containing protein At1g69350, mitochondrial [Magnolia sinica]